MSEEVFFFDTYAFMEIIGGNSAYKKYESANAITTIFNLAELNYALKKTSEKETADKITKKFEQFMVEASLQDVMEAMDLKTKNRKLSIPDCVGYLVARKSNVRFLTGDKQFKEMPNVEFVK